MASTVLDGFDFYELDEKSNVAAVMSFVEGIKDVRGNFRARNLLKRDAAYRRASGNSEIWNYRFIPITVYEMNNKMVDLAKLERDYIANGRKTEDLVKYQSLITQLKTRWFSLQMYPKAAIVESEAVSRTEAMLLGKGDAERGLIQRVGGKDFADAALSAETNENNNTFLNALRKKTITLKKRRWDGGVADEDEDETVDLPQYTQYTCPKAYMEISDFGRIRAQLTMNLADTPDLQQKYKLLVSPTQFENIIENNEKLQNTDFVRRSGLLETGELPELRGFTVEAHPSVKDNEAFAYIPKITVGVSDWGTFTDVRADANIWTVSTARRQYQYDCKVVQPLALIQIGFTGATENFPLGTKGSTEVGDEVFDKVRDPKGVLTI